METKEKQKKLNALQQKYTELRSAIPTSVGNYEENQETIKTILLLFVIILFMFGVSIIKTYDTQEFDLSLIATTATGIAIAIVLSLKTFWYFQMRKYKSQWFDFKETKAEFHQLLKAYFKATLNRIDELPNISWKINIKEPLWIRSLANPLPELWVDQPHNEYDQPAGIQLEKTDTVRTVLVSAELNYYPEGIGERLGTRTTDPGWYVCVRISRTTHNTNINKEVYYSII